MVQWERSIEQAFKHYRYHLLIVIVAFLIALTFAHPSLLLTDEMVTVNQLSQLHEGHQIIFNEGKYGVFENGTATPYFASKGNYLAYSLFLPIISLPSYWLIDFFGNNFPIFILYVWTFLLIALALILNAFFPEWTNAGKWRWTNGLIGLTFIVFFLNLILYVPFPLMGKTEYVEIVAIVFTNILLFTGLSGMIYEICRIIFEDSNYAFFAALTCISCSSYLFWTSFCKDHVLVAFLVIAIILFLIKMLHEDNIRFLLYAFVTSGILAWARPELALSLTIALCVIVIYFLFFIKKGYSQTQQRVLLLSPFCTLIGAIPFFINNYIYNHNILIPPFANWNAANSNNNGVSSSVITLQQSNPDTLGSVLHLAQTGTNIDSSTFFSDLYGILIHPQNGSMGILPIIPVFLIVVLLFPLLVWDHNLKFTSREKRFLIFLSLMTLGIFFTYFRGIAGMNSSLGIVPDIRYLSPMYLPMTIIGLLIVRKIPQMTSNPLKLVQWMFVFWIFLIPLTLFVISYSWPIGEEWAVVNLLLDSYLSITIYLFIVLLIIAIILHYYNEKKANVTTFLFALICSLPLVWQIDASFVARLCGIGLGGYTFWIPVVFKSFLLIFGYESIF